MVVHPDILAFIKVVQNSGKKLLVTHSLARRAVYACADKDYAYLSRPENAPQLWASSHKDGIRYGITTSNNAETLNFMIKVERRLSLMPMIGSLYTMMMKRIGNRIENLLHHEKAPLCPLGRISKYADNHLSKQKSLRHCGSKYTRTPSCLHGWATLCCVPGEQNMHVLRVSKNTSAM